jgi:hypothetical protein
MDIITKIISLINSALINARWQLTGLKRFLYLIIS